MAVEDPVTSDVSFDFTGHTVLLAGAHGGIGSALARAFDTAGADLVLLVEDGQQPQSLRAGTAVVRLDLGVRQGRADVISRVVHEHAVDIVVNAAGSIVRGPSTEFSDDDWYGVIEVNLHAAFDLARAAGRAMIAGGRGGKIVTVASLLSFQGGFETPSYTASKHAVAGLTRALANEWAGHGVNVNAIAPGYVDTPLVSALRDDPERSAALTNRIPAGRWARPDDVTGAALFLASSAADYVHGHVLVVDGGWLSR